MIAQVIINKPSKQTDKKFDYLIPEELSQTVVTGSRVCVPFGRTNKREEAYVLGVCDFSKAKNIKAVISAEPEPVFDEKTAALIEWMREKYLCTYIDAIKAIVPSGTAIRPIEYLKIADEAKKRTPKEEKIFSAVRNNGGEMGYDALCGLFENENIRQAVSRMYEKGILIREFKDHKSVRDKTVRIVSLAAEPEEVYDIISDLNKKRAYAQAKALEVLASTDVISAADLTVMAECGYGTLNALFEKGLIEYSEAVVMRSYRPQGRIKPSKPPVLTLEQENACKRIRDKMATGGFFEFLIHGVTGSGKTEIFMNIINAVTQAKKKAVMLVPEISLTPQMMERFISRFGSRVAVFHSGLSMGERYDEWKRMRSGEADIVIGARSAVFAPFDDIGVIIIDEEHEATYKSEMTPRYDTKEVAAFRARQGGFPVIYASATPDVRTYKKAEDKRIDLIELKTRINKNPIPEVSIIDMRRELSEGNRSVFSRKLFSEIEKNLNNGEQTILFLNRRGFSTFVSCRSCGYVAYCPNCNISLTYHKYNDLLKCHYCGYTIRNYTECPRCKSRYIRYFGGGTQKIEEEVKKNFPNAQTLRMDVDTTGRKNAHEKILSEFAEKKADILIGTQMVAKGLDFPDVTLVGVISADTMLNVDDFRAGERAFDLLEQVAGRAGRADKKGRAVIQTYSPENKAVLYAKAHDYAGFYRDAIAIRRAMWYPPFCEMISVLFSGQNEKNVSSCARNFAKLISPAKSHENKTQILGPIPAPISRIKNKYRWRILIKTEDPDRLGAILSGAAAECSRDKNFEEISIIIDKNPNNVY